jgi:hypothetical protein
VLDLLSSDFGRRRRVVLLHSMHNHGPQNLYRCIEKETNHSALLVLGVFFVSGTRGKRQLLLKHPSRVYHSLDLSTSIIGHCGCVIGHCCRPLRNELVKARPGKVYVPTAHAPTNRLAEGLSSVNRRHLGRYHHYCCRPLRKERDKTRPSNVFFAAVRPGSTRADITACRRAVIGE